MDRHDDDLHTTPTSPAGLAAGIGTLILVETSAQGNLGAAMRVAANFGVRRLHLVRPCVPPDDDEVLAWACGGDRHLEIRVFETLEAACADCRTVAATASGRGRYRQPLVSLAAAAPMLAGRGLDGLGIVFGNETSGLRRHDLDACDVVIQVPTVEHFPVLNLTQTVAIVTSHLTMHAAPGDKDMPVPAAQQDVDALMRHLGEALLAIGFLDPVNPDRMLRKIRRLIGRAGPTEDEVSYLRGMCRQMLWAAKTGPLGDGD